VESDDMEKKSEKEELDKSEKMNTNLEIQGENIRGSSEEKNSEKCS